MCLIQIFSHSLYKASIHNILTLLDEKIIYSYEEYAQDDPEVSVHTERKTPKVLLLHQTTPLSPPRTLSEADLFLIYKTRKLKPQMKAGGGAAATG